MFYTFREIALIDHVDGQVGSDRGVCGGNGHGEGRVRGSVGGIAQNSRGDSNGAGAESDCSGAIGGVYSLGMGSAGRPLER